MPSPQKILIVGGGIGGLAAALALLRRGLDVTVYEAAAELREVGAGVQIGANGTRVLHALGLKSVLEQTQFLASGKAARLWNTGETWHTFDLGEIAQERYGSPHIFMHRGDLQTALSDAIRQAKPDAIVLGRRLASLTQDDAGVTLTFDDGTRVRAALVIGADGIHSKVREILFGRDAPEFAGIVAWRGLVPMHELPPQISRTAAVNWLGPNGHGLHYPVRRGELMNIVAFGERSDWQVESWTARGSHDEIANDFRGWHADLHEILRRIAEPFKWALMLRPKMPRWSVGSRDADGRRLPSDAAVPGPGRGDGDRGRLCAGRLHSPRMPATTRRRLPPTRPSGARAPRRWWNARFRPAARRSTAPLRRPQAPPPISIANGGRSASPSATTGSIATTPPLRRYEQLLAGLSASCAAHCCALSPRGRGQL